MGVTGSGKTFTMANVIQRAAAARRWSCRTTRRWPPSSTREFKEFFPHNAVALLRQLLRLLPARGVHPAARHLHREGRLDQPGDRPAAAGGHQRPGQPPRRDHRGQRLVHLRPGLARGLPRDDGRPARVGKTVDRDEMLSKLVDIQYERNDIEFQPGKFRVRGDCVEIWPSLRGVRLPHRVLGRRGRAALDHQSHQRRGDRAASRRCSSIPAKHFVLPEERIAAARRRDQARSWTSGWSSSRTQGKLLEAQRLSARTRFDIEMLQEVGYCPGIENYSRPLIGPAAGLAARHAVQLLPRGFPAVRRRIARHACRRSAACTPATTTAR